MLKKHTRTTHIMKLSALLHKVNLVNLLATTLNANN